MTIIEGQIESLKKLKDSLRESGITRFNSIGEIRRFVRNCEAEKKQLRSRVERVIEAEIQDMQSALASHQQFYEELETSAQNEIKRQINKFKAEIALARDRSKRGVFYRTLYFIKIKYLSRRLSGLENNAKIIVKRKTANAENAVAKLENEIEVCRQNKEKIISARCKKSLSDLIHTKQVVDGLYTLVAGAVGEASVVKALQQLPDDCYLINDFSLNLDPPIYNSKEDDRIFSVQIDHVLVCRSGVFLLETKNWSKASVESLDLRSPVKQILRTSFALFVLLNSDSQFNGIQLERHHWGIKKIPIRNIIVMINEKPKEEFKHVKVLSLKELIGYIQYFDQTFNCEDVAGIFEYLKNRM